MATTEQEVDELVDDQPDAADSEPILTPKISTKWAATPVHAGIALLFGLLFLLLNFLPLRPTDLWGHVNYGHWMIAHGELPTQDPFLHLSEGVNVICTMWLSQLVFALLDQYGGPEALSSMFAIVGLITYILLGRIFYLQSRRPVVVLLGMAAALLVGWSRLTTIRPENFGLLFFVVLLWLIVSSRAYLPSANANADQRQFTWRLWIGVPLVMMLWVNMHGSFVCGLAVLGCFFLGAAIDILWRTRSLRQLFVDKTVRRWLYLTELAVLATLVNPYGIDLLLYTTLFSSNENLREVLEWQPLVLLGVGGREFALSWVILLFAFRFSKQPIPVAHVLLLGLFGALSAFGIRMLTWYAPIFAIVLTPHLTDIVSRLWPAARTEHVPPPDSDDEVRNFAMPKGRSFMYSFVCLFIVWISFALSPISNPLLGGVARTPEQLYGQMTPVNLVSHLKENPTVGQVHHPQYWGDWLTRETEGNFKPFVTANIHVVPRQVWRDYVRIYGGANNIDYALKRYKVDTVILDKSQQEDLRRSLRDSEDWQKTFEDDQAIVYLRRVRVVEASADKGEIKK